ncbi:MAG: MmgE/PrpD family protein [Chloroflexota bacterium]
MTPRLTARLASFAAGLTYEQLPPTAVEAIKRILLDCLGTALAGSSLGTGARELLAVVEASGGNREAAILGTSLRAPAVLAALANGGLAHALNYDDYLPGAGVHLGVTSVPASLAAAEHAGGVSGKELMTALAAGNELMARVGFAIERGHTGYTETRPQISQMLGYLNSAACAGRALRLDQAGLHSALGMAFMQASGGRQPVLEGTPAKALYAAFPSQGGMLSALLAEQGLGAECAAFEGEAGLFATYFGNSYAEGELTDGLGDKWRFQEITFKPWPTTSVAHVFIEAAISLAQQHDLRADDVARVHLRGEAHIRTFCEPAATRQAPRSSVEAEDSIPFAVAKALANRQITLADIQPHGLAQPEALRLAARTTYAIDGSLGTGGIVELTTSGGQALEAKVARALGHPPRELSWEQLVAKFRDCAQHALQPVDVEEALDLIAGLERLDDVGRLVAAVSSGNR